MMKPDLTSAEFTLGAFNYKRIKSHDSGVEIFEVSSAYNNPLDPGCGYSVVEKGHSNFEYPLNSLANHAFSRHELPQAEKLYNLLIAIPSQRREEVGKGYMNDLRRPAYRIPNAFVS